MERRFPWWWTEGRIELLVAGVCILCAAFAAPVFVNQVLDSYTYTPQKNELLLVISTAFWAWSFRRVLWKRNLVHAFWVAPLFGAFNAGTTLGLSTLVAGKGGSEAIAGVLTGTVFGTFVGGGPLGVGFGAVLALYLKSARAKIASQGASASLHVLRASAWVFALAGAAASFMQMQPKADDPWPTNVLLLVGGIMALVATITHLRAILWTRKVRAGAESGAYIRRDASDVELVVLEERGAEEGAFRTPEHERVLGPLPQGLGFAAAQSATAMVIIFVAWAVLQA